MSCCRGCDHGTKQKEEAMTTSTPLNARTELRLQILKNNYTPLPNVEKRPGIPAWQKVTPDEASIKQWGRQQKTLTTGIRLDNRLIAFDFDIDDPEIDDLFDALLAAFPALNEGLMRTGGGRKEAWLLKCDETFSRIASPIFKDRHVEEKSAMLEVFGGRSPRQFGAFGPHSEGTPPRLNRSTASAVHSALQEALGASLSHFRAS